jgi:hypothetical protein
MSLHEDHSEIGDRLIPDRKVKERYYVSRDNDMWIKRQEAKGNGFPAAIRIGRVKYRKLSELIAWERSLARGERAA